MSTAAQPLLNGGALSPPPYGTSNHHHHYHHHHNHNGHHGTAYIPHVHPIPVVVQPQYPGTVVVVRPRPRCRFLRAFIIAIIIWALLGAIIRSIVLCHHGYCPGFRLGRPHQWGIGPGSQSPGYPIPPGVDLTECEEPLRDGPGPSQTTFEIASPGSEAFLLMSAGAWLVGGVQVKTTPNADSVKFSVSLRARRNRTANTIVCSVKRREGEYGVGIFNPFRPRRDNWDLVHYDVVVELPENHPIIKRFETNVINASHKIGALQGKILFEELSLHGSNGGIKSESLFAQWANIRTSNGPIEGYYNASDDLMIATSNSPIDVDIDFNQQKSRKGTLSLATTNSPLKANLNLHDLRDDSGKTDSSFLVNTFTTNSHLDVTFNDAPVDSLLTYRGRTTNSPAEVSLHPTFEGHFALDSHSIWFRPVVHERRVEDPAGRGRERAVRFRNVGGFVDGDISWGDSSERAGAVDVQTTNGRVTLNL